MHARPPGRLTDRLRVVTVVLAAFDIGFDVLGRDKSHLMAERGQFAGPIVRPAAGFQGDDGRRELPEEGDHLCAAEVDAQQRTVLLIDAA